MATFSDHRFWWWLDIETTGSRKEDSEVIEVAWVITDPDLAVLNEQSFLVVPEGPINVSKINKTVARMHTDNGLWTDWLCGERHTLRNIQNVLVGTLQTLGKDAGERILLCGSGAGRFDKPFLEHKAPGFCGGTAYYDLDVSVLRRFFNWDTDFRGKAHRALDDCKQAIEEFRFYKEKVSCLS